MPNTLGRGAPVITRDRQGDLSADSGKLCASGRQIAHGMGLSSRVAGSSSQAPRPHP